ncbi:MAG: peptidylprolyl isomerase [Candidatus Neomarinimicrobiota bacterium]
MKKISILLVSLILILSSCTFNSNDQVAKVNGKFITSSELYKYIPKDNFEFLSREQKEEVINEICENYLMREFLEEEGIFDAGDIYWEMHIWEIKELANAAFKKLVSDHVLNDKTIKEHYNKTKYDLNLSHILLGFNNPKDFNSRTREEAKLLINKISKELNKDNFNDLAIKYSDDKNIEDNQGSLGWVKVGQLLDEFEDVAYSLKPGEISEPFETEFGFHIVKLNERKENIVEAYEHAKLQIEEVAMISWRSKFVKREQNVLDSLEKEYPLVLFDSTVTDFLNQYKRLSTNVFFSEQFNTFDILNIINDSLVLGKIGDLDIDKTWVIDYLKLINIKQAPRFTDRASFDSFIEMSQIGSRIYKSALDMGLDKSTDFLSDKNVFMAKRSSEVFDQLYVYDSIKPTDEELKNFYEKIKDDKYYVEAKVQVKEVLLKDEEEAKKILERIKNGEDISKLAEKHSIRNIGKKNKGIIPPFKKNQYGEMSLAAFEMEDGEISGPFKISNYYSVIQRIKYIPESYREYDKVLYRLLSDYKNHYIDDVRAEKKEMLKNKYSLKINSNFIGHEN